MEDFFFVYTAPVLINFPYIFGALWLIGFTTACICEHRDLKKYRDHGVE